jgi:hypothetical protein
LDGNDLSSDEVVTDALLEGNLLTTKSYRVEVQAIDDIGNIATSEIIVSTDKVYWHRDGVRNALGLGKYNEQDNALDSAWDFYMNAHRVTGLPAPVDSTDAVPLGFLKDYIVEQGTSGIWTYRKWNSGTAECWGMSERVTATIDTVWGSLYTRDDAIPNYTYPFDFVSLPVVNITPRTHSGNLWLFTGEGGTVSQSPTVSVARPTIMEVTLDVYYHVIGRWK